MIAIVRREVAFRKEDISYLKRKKNELVLGKKLLMVPLASLTN